MPDFQRLWRAACGEEKPDTCGAAGRLMSAIADLFEAEQIADASVHRAALFLLDLSHLGGFKEMDLNVVMVAHPPENDEEAHEQANLLAQYKSTVESLGFCLYIVLSWDLETPNPFVPPSLHPVFICGADLERLFSAQVPSSVLFEVIRRQVNLQQVCPFNTTEEARGAMFKGRAHEVERLTSQLDTHFVVNGARRVGKTSLLKKATNVLRIHPEYRGRVRCFTCLTWGTHWDCFDRIAHEVDPKRELRIEKGIRNVSYMFERRSARGSKPLLLFFDELDRVVDIDEANDWPFFRVLAEAASARWIRVVFAGYRSMTRLALGDSPFHGSLEPLTLKSLTRGETFSLIAEPFQSIGIPIENEDVVCDRIWQATEGYPFLVQFYGEQLYQLASERSAAGLNLGDVEDIGVSYELTKFLVGHFLENTLDNGVPVASERLCAYLYAQAQTTDPWAEGRFLEACAQAGRPQKLDEIHRAVTNLRNACVLRFQKGGYTFTFPVFREILTDTYPNVDTFVNAL
ncbi:MAG: hypothetical protein GWP08_00860 [Nitrospiraceae bacterium]|nr:hypothetical protein [Nitrospiraceae bacterium]